MQRQVINHSLGSVLQVRDFDNIEAIKHPSASQKKSDKVLPVGRYTLIWKQNATHICDVTLHDHCAKKWLRAEQAEGRFNSESWSMEKTGHHRTPVGLCAHCKQYFNPQRVERQEKTREEREAQLASIREAAFIAGRGIGKQNTGFAAIFGITIEEATQGAEPNISFENIWEEGPKKTKKEVSFWD